MMFQSETSHAMHKSILFCIKQDPGSDGELGHPCVPSVLSIGNQSRSIKMIIINTYKTLLNAVCCLEMWPIESQVLFIKKKNRTKIKIIYK